MDVLWVFIERVDNWEAKLPSDSRKFLQDKRENPILALVTPGDSTIKLFPHISTTDSNYSPVLVGLLSNLASYQIYEAKYIIEDMVNAAT